MNNTLPIEHTAAALYTCISRPDIIPDIDHKWRGVERPERPGLSDLRVYSFPQTWGSTSMGFGGMGGAAMTTAQTVVIICDLAECAAIFFGGRLAYIVDNPPKRFYEDLGKHVMASVSKAKDIY